MDVDDKSRIREAVILINVSGLWQVLTTGTIDFVKQQIEYSEAKEKEEQEIRHFKELASGCTGEIQLDNKIPDDILAILLGDTLPKLEMPTEVPSLEQVDKVFQALDLYESLDYHELRKDDAFRMAKRRNLYCANIVKKKRGNMHKIRSKC